MGKTKAGKNKNPNLKIWNGVEQLFKSNLTPSIAGCNNPNPLTLLGPRRFWEYLNNFRSNNVKNATPNKIKMVKIKIVKILINKRRINP